MEIYTKAAPDATYVDIAKKMREEEFRIFLIALVCLRSVFFFRKDGNCNDSHYYL